MKPRHKKIKQRGRPAGMTFADELAQKRMLRKACEDAARDQTLRLQANMQTQRQAWMTCVSLHRAFGFGAQRFQRYMNTQQEVACEIERMTEEVDAEYAWEKIRQEAEKISRMKITYLYEAEIKDAREKHKKEGWT